MAHPSSSSIEVKYYKILWYRLFAYKQRHLTYKYAIKAKRMEQYIKRFLRSTRGINL